MSNTTDSSTATLQKQQTRLNAFNDLTLLDLVLQGPLENGY